MRSYRIDSIHKKHNGTIVKASNPYAAIAEVFGYNAGDHFTKAVEIPMADVPLIKQPLQKPFRLGKSNHLAIVDVNGQEVLKLPFGTKDAAQNVCHILNKEKE